MRFIGIGGDCQVSHNLKRTQSTYEKHFFDWLVVPSASVINLIETDFKSILIENNLEPLFRGDKLERVTDKQYNIWYMHDFKSLEKSDVENVQQKYRYLADKFMGVLASQEPICFVRRWHPLDGPENDASAEKLLKAIRKKSKKASLLYVHQDGSRPLICKRNFTSVVIKDVVGDWRGDEQAWEKHLSEFKPE